MPVYPVDGLDNFAELPVQTESEDEGNLLNEDGDLILSEVEGDTFTLEGDPFEAQRADPNKGMQVIIPDNGYLWAITGSGVYKVDQGGSATFIGGISGSSAITADVNRDHQIGIVSDSRYYVLDTVADTLTDWTDFEYIDPVDPAYDLYGPLYAPNSVVHYNGYMVLTYSNARWQISNLNDARYFALSDLGFFTFRGDGCKRALVRGGDLIIFGERSLEFWKDVGATNGFTMSRVSATEVGIGSPLSAANIDESVLFIDDNLAVRQIEGYQAITISTPFIARKIREAADPDSIRATTYERDGHKFYTISCDDFTLTYNLATQLWHEEKTEGLNRRVIASVAKLNNKWYAGHYAEGKIFRMSPDYYKDNTDLLVMEVETPPVHNFPNRVRVKSLFIDALFGTAAAADTDADESDPKILVYISEDGGENWIYLEELSLGDINSKYEELRVQGVGTSEQNGFCFRLVISTPVVRGILGMAADVSQVRA